ncbi:Ldh family oxidoreductase [Ensifer sp. SSB1]|jgi:LDH2 family malate/lactate/ureidoglycolate dehydrogenase|uniref:Ldh family oxidoreductase n=1 Tax=Ensifer sp. SSB1 TaxID=2795385 RepID=UPI001A48F111|nr:Ldh family oxidoreductase [Ensifer sp. SSB1]MBK5570624.1 Ldh family oxidoreductase [Ensifer sp. SSB1]
MQSSNEHYSYQELERWVEAVFRANNVIGEQAEMAAKVLVRTNLRGIDTHGVSRVAGYVQKIKSGEVNAQAKPSFSVEDDVLRFDGDGGLGQFVATQAIRQTIELAQSRSVTLCMIRESGHLAAIGQFVLEAAEAGMVAILCQETPPLMALEGSRGPAIGNNPIAFAFPVAGKAPLVFDMATSVVARGNVLQAIADGREAIPEGWAIGPDGRPTTDPSEALKGAMAPIAGHKGVGLAMLVQVLAGSLTGSLTATSATKHGATSSAGNVSAFLLMLNPDRLVGRETFDGHVRGWLDTYLSATGEGSRYPGERAGACEVERRKGGIPLPASTIAELRKIGAAAGVPFDLVAAA